MKNQFSGFFKQTGPDGSDCGQDGSIILIVLMLLTLMSVVGISSTNTTVTENLIVRNSAIRKQNLHMVDAVAMEAYQIVMDAAAYDNPYDPDEFFSLQDDLYNADISNLDWFHDIKTWESDGNQAKWYDTAAWGRILTAANSEAPQSILNMDVLTDRGEPTNAANSPIRYAFAGWETVPGGGESIGVNKPGSEVIEIGHIFVEYVSARFGIMRLVVGLKTRTG